MPRGIPRRSPDRADLPLRASTATRTCRRWKGVRRSQYDTLVKSVFHTGRFASEELVEGHASGSSRTGSGRRACSGRCGAPSGHSVADLLPRVPHPTLVIWGANDQVLSDVPGAIRRGRPDPQGPPGRHPQVRPRAPDREGPAGQPARRPLTSRTSSRPIPPALDPSRFLASQEARAKPDSSALRGRLTSRESPDTALSLR